MQKPRWTIFIALLISVILFDYSAKAEEHKSNCALLRTGLSVPERDAYKRIIERSPIELPGATTQKETVGGRTQLCLRIGENGEVTEVQIRCGDLTFGNAAKGSVKTWKFKPLIQNGSPRSFSTYLTFIRKDGIGRLIWDFKEYPLDEPDALSLVKEIPTVNTALQEDPYMRLDIDSYPEERDGIFYRVHLFSSPPDAKMLYTSGWYCVNAYTAEVWYCGSETKKLSLPNLLDRQKDLTAKRNLSENGYVKYRNLNPDATGINGPCADRLSIKK